MTSDLPYPRGELLVRADKAQPLKSWICNTEQLKEIEQRFTKDGFFKTGDIVRALKDGSYQIIDRSSAVQKLAHGKFFSPETIEQTLGNGFFSLMDIPDKIKHLSIPNTKIFVDSNEDKTQIIVLFRTSSLIPKDKILELSEEFLKLTQKLCHDAGIPSSEIPTVALIDNIDDGGWSLKNGLLTPSLKLKRPKMRERMHSIYRSTKAMNLLPNQISTLEHSLTNCPKSVEDLAAFILNKTSPIPVDKNLIRNKSLLTNTFVDLGYSSLQLNLLANQLPDMSHAIPCVDAHRAGQLTVPLLYNKSPILLAKFLWKKPSSPSSTKLSDIPFEIKEAPLEEIGGSETDISEIPQIEEQLKRQLLEDRKITLAKFSKRATPATLPQKKVKGIYFLTGASGFLGGVILRKLIASKNVEKIYCLVRKSPKNSPQNLKSRILHTDPFKLSSVYDKKVHILYGDIEDDQFSIPDYNKMIQIPFTGIIHAAAKVKSWNLAQGLKSLLQANVYGSLRIAKLAYEIALNSSPGGNERISTIPVTFISTASVCKNRELSEGATCSLSQLSKQTIERFDAYSGSKLMAENILKIASEVYNMPLLILRPPLLTWDRESFRNINSEDWINRLVDTSIQVMMVPEFNPSSWTHLAMSVNDCAQQVVNESSNLLSKTGIPIYQIINMQQNVKTKSLKIAAVFESLISEADKLGIHMLRVPWYSWLHGIKSVGNTCPTPYLPLAHKMKAKLQKDALIKRPPFTKALSPEQESIIYGPALREKLLNR
jgi:thioester reductase-like protein